MAEKFLGRPFDSKTMTYSFEDGSGGVLPIEMTYDVDAAVHERQGLNALCVFGTIWAWKKRLGIEE